MKISIITINLNNKDGLNKTISSVAKQTFKDYEYIVIDGASTDGSVNLIRENSDSIHYWKSEKDTGIFNAMNKGLAMATGTYCLFLNSGDYLADDKILEQVCPTLTDDIVYGDLYFEYPNNKIITAVFEDNMSIYKLTYTSLPHQGTFIKTSILNEVGGYKEEFKIISDWFFFIDAIVKCNASFKKINTIISYFDKSGVSSSTDFGYEQTNAIKKYYPFLINEFKAYYELRKYKLSSAHQSLDKMLKRIKGK